MESTASGPLYSSDHHRLLSRAGWRQTRVWDRIVSFSVVIPLLGTGRAAAGEPMKEHVAICGLSFCGSTVLSYVLGSLPGAATIGESHWLVGPLPDGTLLGCGRCGTGCTVITPTLREQLRTAGADWYDVIGAALGPQVLVSSDKDHALLDRLDPDGRRSELLVFKSPIDHLRSYVRALTGDGVRPDVEWYPRGWAEHYGHELPIRGRRAFLLFDDFRRSPSGCVAALADWLGLPFDPRALEYWEFPHHAVGGNFNPYEPTNFSRRRIDLDRRAAVPVPEKVLEAAVAASDAPRVFDALLASERRIVPLR